MGIIKISDDEPFEKYQKIWLTYMLDALAIEKFIMKWFPIFKDFGVLASIIGFVIVGIYKVAPFLLGYAERKMALKFQERADLLDRVDKLEKELSEWKQSYFELKNTSIQDKINELAMKRQEFVDLQDEYKNRK